MMRSVWSGTGTDHCRIGSLEKMQNNQESHLYDHCRIGSLEIDTIKLITGLNDHCRIGSLEMPCLYVKNE